MIDKYYYKINSEVDLETAIKEYKEKLAENKDLKFVIVDNKQTFIINSYPETISPILEVLKDNDIFPHDIQININSEDHYYSKEEWEQIKKADEFFEKKGIEFGFDNMDKTWDVQEVENANSQIMDTANNIRKNNFTPLEKLLAAYLKTTTRDYVSGDENAHYSESRSVYSVLNSEKIVCVGFAEILKALIQEIGDENIKIYSNTVDCAEEGDNTYGKHRNVIVYIKDDKYKIDGYYYLDPTWDCGHEGKYLPSLSYFLVPVQDIDKMRVEIRDPESVQLGVNYKVYKKSSKDDINITRDGFVLNKEFILDFLNKNPELKKIYIEKMKEEELLKIKKQNNLSEQNIETLEDIKQMFLNEGILYLTRQDNAMLYDCLRKSSYTGDYEEIIKFKDKMIEAQEQKLTILEDFLGKLNAEDSSMLRVKNRLQKEQDSFNEEGYEDFIREMVEMDKYFSQQSDDISDEERIKLKKEEYSYQRFVEVRKKQILKTQEQLNEKLAQQNDFIEKFKEILKENPELLQKLLVMEPERQEHLFETISYNLRNGNIDETIEIACQEIENIEIDSVDSIMSQEIKYNQDIIKINNDEIANIEQANDETLANYILERPMEIKNICDMVTESSVPLDINRVAFAMNEIMKKTEDMSEEERFDYIKEVMDYNCEIIIKHFNPTATHSLVQYALLENPEETMEKLQ